MPDLKRKQAKSGLRNGVFGSDQFIYDKETDTYECAGGKRLKRKKLHEARQSIDYGALKSECDKCELRPQCTKNKAGRTVKRHLQQEALEQMRELSEAAESKRAIKTRHHLMERTFARAKRYGYKRSRWRRLWRVQIQEYITAAIQNIEILIRYGKGRSRGIALSMAIGNAKRRVYSLAMLFVKYNDDLIFGEENILVQHCGAVK